MLKYKTYLTVGYFKLIEDGKSIKPVVDGKVLNFK